MKAPVRLARKQSKSADGAASTDAQVREEQILGAAARLFKERGYHGATLQDVAEEIGVTRTAVYHYFSSKEEVFYRISEQACKDAADAFEQIVNSDAPPEQKMHHLVRQYIQDMIRNAPRLWLVLTEGEQNLPPRQYRRLHRLLRQQDATLQQVFREGVQSGKFGRLNPKIAVFAIAGMCNWLSRWYDPRGEVDPDSIADTFLYIMEHGYLEPETRSHESMAVNESERGDVGP